MRLNLKGLLFILLLSIVLSQPIKEQKDDKNQHKENPHKPEKPEPNQKANHDPKQNSEDKEKSENKTEGKSQNKPNQKQEQNTQPTPVEPVTPPAEPCDCQNDGKCFTLPEIDEKLSLHNKTYCNCSRLYIGEKCQQLAEQIVATQQLFKFINIYKYKYFYYEPKEEDMLSFTFHLCFDTKTLQNTTSKVQLQNSVTFFLETEDENGNLDLTQQLNTPTTVEIGDNQCKYITVDYTLFTQTKLNTYQKIILAIKLGKRLNMTEFNSSDQVIQNPTDQKVIRSLRGLKYEIITKPNDKNYTLDNWKKKNTSTSPMKKNYTAGSFRRIYLNFIVSPFEVNKVFQTIVFSLITLTAFVVVATMIFILRTRIMGVPITASLSYNSRLSNDLSYFEVYMPSEFYIKQFEYDQMRDHYHHQSSSDDECSICIAALETNELIRKTPCNHVFHTKCLDVWCAQNLTCPICRRSLTQARLKEFYSSSMEQRSNSADSLEE